MSESTVAKGSLGLETVLKFRDVSGSDVSIFSMLDASWSSDGKLTPGNEAPKGSIDGPLKLTNIVSARDGVLRLDETVENLGLNAVDVLWRQQLTLPGIFVCTGCRIDASAASYFDPREEPILRLRWPMQVDGEDLSRINFSGEKVYYLSDFSEGRCRVEQTELKIAVELCWDMTSFPYCWFNQRRDALCLSPCTGLPKALEEGHGLLSIPAGGRETAWFEVRVI